ncbi:MAG: hypothetical protein IJW73_00060, partial [Candidatus Gastranaerophilales bacterium]|nr:hypothetical protein [Candidatus Gastranaerophilales bacterium]
MNIENKKILILGFSLTGIAAAKYFNKKGANVFISEFREQQEKDEKDLKGLTSLGIKVEFNGHSDEFILNSEFCILSPSIPMEAPILAKLKENNIE